MTIIRYTPTDRIGVNAVEHIVLNELKWIFREQPIVDMGIDAQIEYVDDGKPTGKLIAVQIKTGISHFTDKGDFLVYYGKLNHLDYWTGHSLPVILIAHIPEHNQTYWVSVEESTVQRTEKAWKVSIPKENVFGASNLGEIKRLFDGRQSEQKLRKLTIDLPLMRHIQNGGKVSLDLEDWVNKSLGRTPVRVYVHDEDGQEILEQDWYVTYTGYGIVDLAKALFPWANFSIDEDFYEINEEEYDERYGGFPYERPSLRPYDTAGSGEIEFYRLQFSLNELSKAFLVVSDYLTPI